MKTRARFVIQRLSPLLGQSEDWTQKLVTTLARGDRFVSRKRRDLKASDLGSLLNSVLMNQTRGAFEADDALQELVYRGSAPAGRTAVFQQKTWRDLLLHMIEHAPPFTECPGTPVTTTVKPNTLPNQIEVIQNVPLVSLAWFGPDGRPVQTDWYGPQTLASSDAILARKSVIDGKIINVLGDILRTPAANAGAGTQKGKNETAAFAEAAAPSRSRSTAPISSEDGLTENSGKRQGPNARAPGKFPLRTRRFSDEEPYPSPRPGS